jgi:hypothetical protein
MRSEAAVLARARRWALPEPADMLAELSMRMRRSLRSSLTSSGLVSARQTEPKTRDMRRRERRSRSRWKREVAFFSVKTLFQRK